MEEKIEFDLAGKVVMDLEKYLNIHDELLLLKESKDKKYDDLVRLLFANCELVKYTNGKAGLEYDSYREKIIEYLKEKEPEKYEKRLNELLEREN